MSTDKPVSPATETKNWRAGYQACKDGLWLKDVPSDLSENDQDDWVDGWGAAERSIRGAWPEVLP